MKQALKSMSNESVTYLLTHKDKEDFKIDTYTSADKALEKFVSFVYQEIPCYLWTLTENKLQLLQAYAPKKKIAWNLESISVSTMLFWFVILIFILWLVLRWLR